MCVCRINSIFMIRIWLLTVHEALNLLLSLSSCSQYLNICFTSLRKLLIGQGPLGPGKNSASSKDCVISWSEIFAFHDIQLLTCESSSYYIQASPAHCASRRYLLKLVLVNETWRTRTKKQTQDTPRNHLGDHGESRESWEAAFSCVEHACWTASPASRSWYWTISQSDSFKLPANHSLLPAEPRDPSWMSVGWPTCFHASRTGDYAMNINQGFIFNNLTKREVLNCESSMFYVPVSFLHVSREIWKQVYIWPHRWAATLECRVKIVTGHCYGAMSLQAHLKLLQYTNWMNNRFWWPQRVHPSRGENSGTF